MTIALLLALLPTSVDAGDVEDGAKRFDAKDYLGAAELFRRAADKGDANGQFFIGLSYEMGRGVPQEKSEAEKWLRKAAAHGSANAQNRQGLIHSLKYKGEECFANIAEVQTTIL